MEIIIEKWRVKKCKNPSTRWVAWRVRQKKRTGEIFDSWVEAMAYALGRQELDFKLRQLKRRIVGLL